MICHSKYKAQKTEIDGIVFDSKKEATRYLQLRELLKAGEIQNLRRQVKYVLIPAQREQSTEVFKSGKNKGKLKDGKLLEKECSYYADFVYQKGDEIIVEDVKGIRTDAYKIKRKLMLKEFGIKIKEV